MKEMESLNIGTSNFNFSATKIDDLGATEYTLSSVLCDISGSLGGFEDKLLMLEKALVEKYKKLPKAENIMLRLLHFNNILEELHGFKTVNSINQDDYKQINTRGTTALIDATYSAIGATLTYAKTLIDQDFDVNGIIFIITDGCENTSTMTMNSIKTLINDSKKQENIESLITVLIGVTEDDTISSELENFKNDAGLSDYINAGEINEKTINRIIGFVSQLTSSQSQSLGSGATSQPLTF